jgi:endoglucanase
MWQIPSKFPELRVPENDRYIIVSFHTYTPMPFTHYKAPWTSIAFYEGPVQYPGQIVETDDLKDYSEEQKKEMARFNGYYDKEVLAKDIQIAVEKAKEWGLPLYCGEFGVYLKTPVAARDPWYRDIIALFEEHGIAWANWDYKGGFGLIRADGSETGIRHLLFG